MWFKRAISKPAPPTVDSPPSITAATIAEAKANPNGWVYALEGVVDPNAAVPPERIRGAWKVGPTGEIEGAFIPNPKFRRLETKS